MNKKERPCVEKHLSLESAILFFLPPWSLNRSALPSCYRTCFKHFWSKKLWWILIMRKSRWSQKSGWASKLSIIAFHISFPYSSSASTLTRDTRFCSFGPKMRKRINKCDFSYFCAIAAPFAPRSKFRTICDWGNWVRKSYPAHIGLARHITN